MGRGDLDDEIHSASGVDSFEFVGFLTGGFEACGALFED
jgi:hypothetical protein